MSESLDNLKQSLSDFHVSNVKKDTIYGESVHSPYSLVRLVLAVVISIAVVWCADSLFAFLYYRNQTFMQHFISNVSLPDLIRRSVISVLFAIIIVQSWYRSTVSSYMERALKRSSKWFSTTMKSMDAALIAIDTKGIIIFMNPVAEKLTGWSVTQSIGVPVGNICLLADKRTRKFVKLNDHLDQVINGGESIRFDDWHYLQAADGSLPFVIGTIAPINEGAGKVIGAVLVLHDISDIKRALEEIELLAAVVREADEIIVISDQRGIIEYVNPSYQRLTGYPCETAVGMNISMFTANKFDESFFEKLADRLSENDARRYRFRIITASGNNCQLESRIRSIKDDSGEVWKYISVNRDITREVELSKQVAQSQKMEAIGRLASTVAHDFRNLMNIVGMTNMLIAKSLDEPSKIKGFTEEIDKVVNDAANLVSQLLTFSKKSGDNPVEFNPNTKISEMDGMLKRLLPERIQLTFKPGNEVPPIQVNPGIFGQVLMNLVINAVDAIENDGEIVIHTDSASIDRNVSSQGWDMLPGPYVAISVSDNGAGIDGTTLSHIFEPFYSTKETGKMSGTGLGLAIVYGFVKQVDGDIEVISKVGEGSTFKLYIPIAQSVSV